MFTAADKKFTIDPQQMSASRTGHFALELSDTRLLLFGGDTNNTIDEFNHVTDTITLKDSGDGAASSATLLANGNILVIRPGSAGLYSPDAATFTAFDETSVPGSTALQRSGQTATELKGDKRIFVAGGTNAQNLFQGAALFNPVRIWTDKDNYVPTDPVILSGSGWKSNENVYLYAVDDETQAWTYGSTVTADANGEFVVNPYFIVQLAQEGVNFSVSVVGAHSNMEADVKFVDSVTSVTITSVDGVAPGSPKPLVTLTSLPHTLAVIFNYVTSSSGATSADVDLVGTGVTNTITGLTPGTVSGQTITLNIPSGTTNGTYNVKVTVHNSTGGGANNGNDNVNNAVKIDVPTIAPTTLTVSPANGTYGGSASLSATLTKTSDSSAVSGKTINFTVDGNPVGSGTTDPSGLATVGPISLCGSAYNFGSHTIAASFAGDSSFGSSNGSASLSVGKATATVVVTPYNVMYNGNPHTATVTSINGVCGETGATVGTVDVSSTTHTAQGTYNDTWTFTPTGNYNNITTGNTITDVIGKATLTITAKNQTKQYGTTFSFAGTEFMVTGTLYNSDSVTSVTLTSAGAAATATYTTPGPNYDIVPSAAVGSGLSNYTINYVDGTLTISQAALDITAKDQTKTYGDTFTFLGTEFTTGAGQLVTANGDSVTSVTLSSAGAASTATYTSPGPTYAITASNALGSGLGNYMITYHNGTMTLSQRGLDITAKNQTKQYGDTFTFAGTEFTTGLGQLVNSNNVTSVTLTSAGAAATATYTTPGPNYDIVPSAAVGSGLGNYIITYHNGTMTLSQAALTITAKNESKTYGQTFTPDGTTQFMTSGLVNSDSVTSVTLMSSGYVNTAPVSGSSYDIVPSAAVGTGLGNYTISYANGKLTVNKANATIKVTGYGVTYDGHYHTATGTATGVFGENLLGAPYNDILDLSGTTRRNAGTSNDAWTFTDVTGNYNNANGVVTDEIDQAALTITATTNTKDYDCGTSAAAIPTVGNLQYGDSVTNLAEVYADPNAGTGKTLSVSSYTINDGNNGNNYIVTLVANHTGIINKVNATFNITPYNVTYDTFSHTATGTATGMCSDDLSNLLNFSGTTHTNAGPPTSYAYNDTVTFAGNNNYYSANIPITDYITPRAALVNYIGQQYFVTSGSSSTTAQVTLSASVQDPTGTALTGATMDFIDVTNGLPGKTLATGVKVSPVPNSPANTGTANTIVTLSSGQYGASSYLVLVKMTGNYDNSAQPTDDKTATVTVVKPATTNQTTGGGTIAWLSKAAGTYKGNGNDVSFCVGLSYNKSGSNLQGNIQLMVPQTDGSVVYIKSNSISSMAVQTGSSFPYPKTSTIYTKASVYKIMNNGSQVSIDGGASFRIDSYDSNAITPPDQIGFTVLSSKDSSLEYSNNWALDTSKTPNVWKTLMEALKTGGLSIQ
jgi:MBG domain (YGX type)/Bacterial Ig-like domain (group 3)/YDG domain